MRSSLKPYILSLVIVFLLGGCQISTQPYGILPKNMQVLEQLDHWAIDGKLSVTDGREAVAASFDWQQIGKKMKLDMSGPLGFGQMSIMGDLNGEFWLSSAKTGSVVSPSGSELAQRYIGMPLPVDALPTWLKGIPDRSMPFTFDPDVESRVTTMKQAGWTILLSRYEQQGELLLPHKLEASNGDIRVKVIIKNWDINEA